MKSISTKAALILLFLFSIVSGDLIWGGYYNPGLKLGVQFGKKVDFVLGFENSITAALLYGWPYAGFVGGIEFSFRQKKFIEYWEIEAGFAPVGFAFGGEWNAGYHSSVRVFCGAFAFLSFKHLINTRINEISFIGKYPFGIYEVMDHGTYLFGKDLK